MNEFRLAHPFVLILLPLSLIFIYRWWQRRWLNATGVLQYSDIRLMSNTPSSLRIRLRQLPNFIRLITWVLLVIILARPQTGRTQNIIRGQGIDIVMAVDISGSMAVPDFAPRNRLDASKIVLKNFISGREYDPIGLVVFANDSFQVAPPTLNYNILADIVDDLRLASEVGLQDGSAIGLGIASATNMLRSSTALSQVIILLTDGENNVGAIDAITAAQAANALGIKIYTIGIGQRGIFTLQQPDGTIQSITSNLDESTLQDIARIGSGEYFYAADLPSLQAIYDRIDRLERSPIERQQFTRWQDIGDAWIIGIIILLLLERLIRHTLFQTIP
jgi:Ca-activated chloride channel homolog